MKSFRKIAAAVIVLAAVMAFALAPAAHAENETYKVQIGESISVTMPAYVKLNGTPQVTYKCDEPGIVELSPSNRYGTYGDGSVIVSPEFSAKAVGVGVVRISVVIDGRHIDDVYVWVSCGHRWGAWTIISKPVLNVPGWREHTCELCGDIEGGEIAAPMTDAEYDAMVAADQAVLDSIKPKVLTIKKGGKKVVYQFKVKPSSGRKCVYECAGATAEFKLSRSGKLTVYSNCMRKGKTYRVSVLVSVGDWAERVVNVKIKCK